MSDTLSMYQASVSVGQRALRNLRQLLVKGEAHAQAQGYDAAVLLQMRLYPDMLPLLRQVQIATDGVKNAAARLAGVEALKFEDDEDTFAELYARLDRAIDYLGTFTPEQIDGSEGRVISVPRRNGEPLSFEVVESPTREQQLEAAGEIFSHVREMYEELARDGRASVIKRLRDGEPAPGAPTYS